MTLPVPYGQNNYLGSFANENDALTWIKGQKWDSTKDGNGTPENGMTFYDETANKMKVYENGAWREETDIYHEIIVPVVDSDTDCAIAGGVMCIGIGDILDGYDVVDVRAIVHTPGTTNTMNIQLRRRRADAEVDILSTEVTITSGEYSAADGVVNLANDDLAKNDLLFVDTTAIHATPAKGLSVIIKCKKV